MRDVMLSQVCSAFIRERLVVHTKELERLAEFFEILEEFTPVFRPVALPQREQGLRLSEGVSCLLGWYVLSELGLSFLKRAAGEFLK